MHELATAFIELEVIAACLPGDLSLCCFGDRKESHAAPGKTTFVFCNSVSLYFLPHAAARAGGCRFAATELGNV